MAYDKFVRQLAPLEYFDAEAFRPGKGISQTVCDFVLALAWVHGDIMDLFLAHELLGEVKPDARAKDTPWWGHWAGILLHLLRIQAGVIHEFLCLIQRNRKVLKDAGFLRVLDSLPTTAKKHWEAIVSVAIGRPSRDPLAKALVIVRNKVAFHYDAAQIGLAYHAFFAKNSADPPVLSKGATLGASRFYFVDAAADYFLLSTDKTKEAKKALLDPKLMEGIAAVLFYIVTQFVEIRGFPWKVGGSRA